MIALVASLVAGLVPQDEARLKEAWPKLAEAWKAVEEYKAPPDAGPLDDEYLKIVARIHAAFESAGLFATDGEYLPQAIKAFVKLRARGLAPANLTDPWNRVVVLRRRIRAAGGAPGALEAAIGDGDPMGALLASLKKLQTLKAGGLDDEENVQDELTTARRSLKALGIMADDTLPTLRRRVLHLVRALALGEAYPASAAATEDQAQQFRAWVAELGHEMIENREKAMKELSRAGEASLPFIREALKNGDAEIATRAKALLGVGHAPWTKVKAPDGQGEFFFDLPMAVPAPAAPAPPKEEKPK